MTAPALLVHSGGLNSRQWRRLSDQLATERQVVAPDLLGYGADAWPVGTPFHFHRDVDHIVAVLDSLAAPAHLVGHSYGGLITLHAALARPDRVRSIAVYEPVTFGVLEPGEDDEALAALSQLAPYRVEDPDAWLAAFVDWWNGPGAWARLPTMTQAAFRATSWKLSEEVASLVTDTVGRAGYAAISAPTLVLAGRATQPAELAVIERLAAAIPHARRQLFDGMGHMGPITHAPAVNAAIAAHIASTEA